MAATSPAASATAAPPTTILQTIFGSHVLRIDGFSGTKGLGVGKSIDSSPFRVGGHGFYIRCYPSGADQVNEGIGKVSLFLLRLTGDDSPVAVGVEAEVVGHTFALIDQGGGWSRYIFSKCQAGELHQHWIRREKLEPLLKDDCLEVRCDVTISRKFHAVVTKFTAGSHILTVDGYSKTAAAFSVGESIESDQFAVGGHTWDMMLYPRGQEEGDADGIAVFIYPDLYRVDVACDELKVRLELTLLSLAGERISHKRGVQLYFSSEDAAEIHVRCDIAVVDGITAAARPPDLYRNLSTALLSSPAGEGGDVTFEVGGDRFTAHRSVLAAQSTGVMAVLFGGSSGKEHAITRLRIVDMEPGVFRALLHFIYTGSLPDEVADDGGRVVMAQGLLVAADRYYMDKLKMACGDVLYRSIDAATAVTTLRMAHKHGCQRLKDACVKFLNDELAKAAAAPPGLMHA
ncbi:hypothetical protein U9M48_001577 [Paspalum notatum var. saurae]|uniref:Uncharacterized protein n=1 Tax=Paspalum notatum var. saurae TaxID=547442 RepID=A0AAQ3SFB4_PASNO